MHALALIYEVRDRPGVRAFKFIQEADLSLELQLVAGPELTSEIEADIRKGILVRMGDGAQLVIRRVSDIPPGEVREVSLRCIAEQRLHDEGIATAAVSAIAHAYPGTRAGRLLILIYHRVRPRPDPMFPGEVDADRFDWQMSLLRRYCRPMALRDAVARPARRFVAAAFSCGDVRRWLRRQRNCSTADSPAARDSRNVLHRTRFPRRWTNVERFDHRGCATGARGSPDLADFGHGVVALGADAARGRVAEAIIGKVKHLAPQIRLDHVNQLCSRIGVDLPGRPDDDNRPSAAARQRRPGDRRAYDDASDPQDAIGRGGQGRNPAEPSSTRANRSADRSGVRFSERSVRGTITPGAIAIWCEISVSSSLVDDAGCVVPNSDLYQLPRFTPWDQASPRWFARLMLAFRAAA